MKCKKLIFATCWLISSALASCRPHPDAKVIEAALLDSTRVLSDHSADSALIPVLTDVNGLSHLSGYKSLHLQDSYDASDTNEVLVIPFAPREGKFEQVTAFCLLGPRAVFIQPGYIIAYAKNKLLNDSTDVQALTELMLLHELGHFALGIDGSFDKSEGPSFGSTLGEQNLHLSPILLTTVKRQELKADSLAALLIQKGANSKNVTCFVAASNLEMLIGGSQFVLSGLRDIEHFGSNHIDELEDPENTHPNLELRMTFMNYYLHPNDSLRLMLDHYLYEREVAPVERQQRDPRIFQGQEKP
jgi:hypothetical protein